MDRYGAKKSSKVWVWIIAIVFIVICGCLLAIGGGFVYFRSQNINFSNGSEISPNATEIIVNTITPEDAVLPTPEIELNDSQPVPSEQLLVTTRSGIWAINEATREAVQLSYDPLDNSWEFNDGLSPDKKIFAYFTGFGGASINPKLVVLDIENQISTLQLELTGPIIQPGLESTHGDPAFEAFGAMQFTDSLAWSPDGTRLAFVAARDGDSADIYLFNRTDNSVTRLTDEAGHASALHWSPDGQLLQYVSVNTFGTGAGFNMEGLWVYDFNSKKAQLLETLDSDGEEFLAWMDNSSFLINSFSRICGGIYNLRIVDATSFDQQVIVDSGFTAVAYDPENKFGMFSVVYNYDNCGSGEPLDAGLMIFGESVPVLGADGPIIGEIGRKKFEQVIAYGIGFIPQGNLFTVYGDEGLQHIYYKGKYGYNSLSILPEVKGLKPYPAPSGDYWAWASYFSGKTGLWITENNENPIQLSPLFTGTPVWSQDGKTIYFIENNQLFFANAPQFDTELLLELPGVELLALVK